MKMKWLGAERGGNKDQLYSSAGSEKYEKSYNRKGGGGY